MAFDEEGSLFTIGHHNEWEAINPTNVQSRLSQAIYLHDDTGTVQFDMDTPVFTTDGFDILAADITAANGTTRKWPMIFIQSAGLAVDSISDTTLENGQTGVIITGSGFGATQGTGFVKISNTDTIDSGSLITQTVTSWADTSITITTVRSTLNHTDTLYLFVEEDGGDSNAAGETCSFNDTTPAYSVTPNVSSQTADTYTITATMDRDSTLYSVAVLSGQDAPTIAQVIAGNSTFDVPAEDSTSKIYVASTSDTDTLGPLTNPVYDIYSVAVARPD